VKLIVDCWLLWAHYFRERSGEVERWRGGDSLGQQKKRSKAADLDLEHESLLQHPVADPLKQKEGMMKFEFENEEF